MNSHLRRKRALVLVPFLLGCAVACGDSQPAPGYYLRGRVFNGASTDPIAQAELSLIAGQSRQHVISDEDGTYQIGPIEPGVSYRLDADVAGMEAFEFTGIALPPLDPEIHDRTLIGDVPLYEKDKTSPGFKLMVQSNDDRMPANIASVDFIPSVVGEDPGLASEPTDELSGVTLPNHAIKDAKVFHTSLAEGEAEIPEGALSWVSTYSVIVDAGPDFMPLQFTMTPVREGDVQVVVQTKRDNE